MQQITHSVALAFSGLPRLHRIMLGSVTVITLALSAWRPQVYHANDSASMVKNIKLEKNEMRSSFQERTKPINQSMQEAKSVLKNEFNKNIASKVSIYEHVVSTSNTLSNILNKHEINMDEISRLATLNKDLQKLKNGQKISWKLTTDSNFQRLKWKISHRETRPYDLVSNNFKMSSEPQQGDWIYRVVKKTVGHSFIASARDAGLTVSEINAVIKAMQWQMDFRKLKRGDQFSILRSQGIFDRNGEREQSQLMGVRLRSGGKDYYAIRAEDGKFYDRNGMIGLDKGFLRFPTEKQFRISSDFNLHRMNPITGRVTPHRGVDFAMPQGTPVLSVGDGEVAVVRHSGSAGFYIAVRHGRIYTTRYMHLRKLLVKPGQKVKRGDRIALSGNTGRSTGPHLHYEVWINQRAVNPLTARLPHTEQLIGKDRCDYLAQVKEVIPQLRFD